MALGALSLYGMGPWPLGCSCQGMQEEHLYQGPVPRSLVIDMDVGSVDIGYKPGAANASIVLEHCGDCIRWSTGRGNGSVRVRVWDACRVHIGDCSKAVLRVTLPEPRLQRLSLTLGVGRAEIRDIAVNVLRLASNVGEIDVLNITVERSLEASVDVGHMRLREIHMPIDATARLRANVGSIDLTLGTKGAHVEEIGATEVGSLHIACPLAKGPLVYAEAKVGSISITCSRAK